MYRMKPYDHIYIVAVKIAQIEEGLSVLAELQNNYGGFLYPRKTSQPNRRQSWAWELKTKKTLIPFLRDILPYLVVKRKQAELLLEYCEMPISHANYRTELRQRKHDIASEIKALIHNGKPVAETN